MPHHSRLAQIIMDCQTDDIDRAAVFWSAALGRPLRSSNDPSDTRYRALDTPAGQPNILLQRVSHASRVHLDIETDDIEAEVTRLEALGAKRVAQVRTWWIMEAPTGHRFCVLRPQSPDLLEQGNRW